MNSFIKKTILTAKKLFLRNKNPHAIDMYLRLQRFRFNQQYPGNKEYFTNIVRYALGASKAIEWPPAVDNN